MWPQPKPPYDVEAPAAVNSISMAATETTCKQAWPTDTDTLMDNHVDQQQNIPNGIAHKPAYKILDLEIDKLDDILWGACRNPITLYNYFEVPEYLRVNPYIHHGYRALLPFGSCIHSLFTWNNESMNIWSHLVGFFIFFVLMIWDNALWIPQSHGSSSDHFIISVTLLCYQFCMLCSAGYHLFLCHSEQAARRWFALDLTGISIGLLGCYLPAIHYAYFCLSMWYSIYFMVIIGLFAVVLYWQTQPRFAADHFQRSRVMMFCGLTAYGIVPVLHWVYLNGGFSTEIVQIFTPKVAVMYLICVVAFFFYFTRFPEVCCPGRFDYIGCSHQWWHILIAVAFFWWHHTGQQLLLHQVKQPCLS